jgi:methylenetetrahydrofolate reductase (NADPH)
MKVIEHILNAKSPTFSFEIVPPPRGKSINEIIEVTEALSALRPSWIDVTSHKSTVEFLEKGDGTFVKKKVKKRPGTLGICGVIQNRFKIDTVAHLLCAGFTREETEDALIELNYLGIHNVLALRGDAVDAIKNPQVLKQQNLSTHKYAANLVEQVKLLGKGQFLEDMADSAPLEFGIGVAGYPEKHFEAPCLKDDIENLKHKVNMGADYIVTQMFFDNQKYFEFVDKCREAGITVPIIPGLKILKSAAQLKSIPKNFYIDIPDVLVDEVNSSPQHAVEIGKKWALKQMQELLEKGAPGLHLYVLNDVHSAVELVKKLQ